MAPVAAIDRIDNPAVIWAKKAMRGGRDRRRDGIDAIEPRDNTTRGFPNVHESAISLERTWCRSSRDIMIPGRSDDALRRNAKSGKVFQQKIEQQPMATSASSILGISCE